jgi:spermidine synthase
MKLPLQEICVSSFVCDLLTGVVKLIPSGKEVFHEEDEYGEIIVSEYRDYRMLRFDAFYEQSKMNLYHPNMPVHHYVRAMLMAITWRRCGPVLLLGLGGGCLLRALYTYAPSMQVDVVELRPRVLDVARRYFSLPSSGNISYYCEDALDYLRRDIGIRYSMIFSDLYSAMAMDPLQGSEAFLWMCRNALSEDGWLVLNYLDMPGADSTLYHALYQVFSDVFFCPVPSGNVVIYARVSPGKCSPEALTAQAAQICNNMFGEVKHLSGRLERL